MSATTTAAGERHGRTASPGPAPDVRAASLRACWALCRRDLWVTVRHEPVSFLSQALLQPIFFLFVFGRVLPDIGAARGAYGSLLLPGIIALTTVLVALQNTALPLVIEFSFTKEIEDRLLAPLPVVAVGVQKMGIAAVRGIIAGALILPLGEGILPGGIDLSHAAGGALFGVILVGALSGAAIGLVLGTAVPPNRISVMFAIILTPLIFTGATFYPWQALGNLEWFQILTLFNPLTYVSEGMRAALTTGAHLGTGWVVLGMAASLAVFGALGLAGFRRRAVD
jgi:ABC-2 type transport system permease protein